MTSAYALESKYIKRVTHIQYPHEIISGYTDLKIYVYIYIYPSPKVTIPMTTIILLIYIYTFLVDQQTRHGPSTVHVPTPLMQVHDLNVDALIWS